MIDKRFWKDKKVFITGHTGFKGAWLSHLLVSIGADVTGYALEPNSTSLYNIIKLGKQIKSVMGDIRNLDCIKTSVLQSKPEIVIHMAAQPLVRSSYIDPVYTYETNVMGTVNILEAARNCDTIKSVVNVTTDKVYQNNEWLWGYRENDVLCGFDPYSNSKSCSELVTYSYKNSFFSHEGAPSISTARSGNVLGGGDFAVDRIIPDCVRAAKEGEKIIVRNPYSTRPYQHVLECLSGYLILAQKQYEDKEKYEGSYNFGPSDNECVTTAKLVDLFCKEWGNHQEWINISDNGPHESNFLKLDFSKSKALLGWRPVWGIETAIKNTVQWSKIYFGNKDVYDCMNNQMKQFFQDMYKF